MADFPKAANGIISEDGGSHYAVQFQWIPRVGELIDLTSFKDIKDKQPESHHFYEVVAVVHVMHDVMEDDNQPREGHHSLKIVVKKSTSKYLRP